MRRLALACCVIAMAAAAAWGNDSRVVGQGGRVRLLAGREDAHIRMVRERVQMDILPTYYVVDATFVFRNSGPAVTVPMGFPEYGHGDIRLPSYGRTPGFRQFTTWVDGHLVRASRQAVLHEMHYQALWVKRVPFAAGQQRTVRVRYESPVSEDTSATRWAEYMFTGGNWQGTVAESALTADLHIPGTSAVWVQATGNPAITRQGAHYELRWTDWQAEGSAVIRFKRTLPGWLTVNGMPNAFQDPPAGAVTIEQPGPPAAVDWLPPALGDGGGPVMVSLRALARWLNYHREPGAPTAWVTWREHDKRAMLEAGGHRVTFTLGRPGVVLDGKKQPLPVIPRLNHDLYVPLAALVGVVIEGFELDRPGRCVTLRPLPPYTAAKPPAPEV